MIVEIFKIDARIHRWRNLAFCALGQQLLHKPEIRVLSTQSNMRARDGNEAVRIESVSDCYLNSQRICHPLTIFSVEDVMFAIC